MCAVFFVCFFLRRNGKERAGFGREGSPNNYVACCFCLSMLPDLWTAFCVMDQLLCMKWASVQTDRLGLDSINIQLSIKLYLYLCARMHVYVNRHTYKCEHLHKIHIMCTSIYLFILCVYMVVYLYVFIYCTLPASRYSTNYFSVVRSARGSASHVA